VGTGSHRRGACCFARSLSSAAFSRVTSCAVRLFADAAHRASSGFARPVLASTACKRCLSKAVASRQRQRGVFVARDAPRFATVYGAPRSGAA